MPSKPTARREQLFFRDFAGYYDIIHSQKDYKGESEKLKALISQHKKSEGKDLLEVACGTGKYLEYFKDGFNCTGVDINKGVLDIARARFPNLAFHEADMLDFDLQKQFDVVLCLFGSINYVKTWNALKQTINNFARHLKSGGCLIIEPFETPTSYKTGVSVSTYAHNDFKIARLRVSEIKGGKAVISMHYLISKNNEQPLYLKDIHRLGLFEAETVTELLKKAGLNVVFLEEGLFPGKGLFIAVKA